MPSDLAQHITFEGCDYCLMSPEDYDELVIALRTLAGDCYGTDMDGSESLAIAQALVEKHS